MSRDSLTLIAADNLVRTGINTLQTGIFTAIVDSPDTDAQGGVLSWAGRHRDEPDVQRQRRQQHAERDWRQ